VTLAGASGPSAGLDTAPPKGAAGRAKDLIDFLIE